MATSEMSNGYSETDAFKVFAAMCWEQHKERHPAANIDPTRFAEISTGRWKAMTQEQKNAFFYRFKEDEAQKAKQTKRKENPTHDNGPKNKKSLLSLKEESKEKEPVKPKAKKTAFSFFTAEVGTKFRKDNPDLSHTEATKAIQSKWHDISQEEKKKYLELAEQDQKRYESEQSSYESEIASASQDMKKPKAKKSAFNFFALEKGSEIKKQNSNLTKNEVAEKVNKLWENIEAEVKQKYCDMAVKDAERFNEEMNAFQIKEGKFVMQAAKDPNKPKKGKSAYMFFNAEYSVQLRKENPESHMSIAEVSKEVSIKWQALTEEEKQKYQDMAEKDKMRHDEEIKNYQAPPPVMVKVQAPKDPNKPKGPKNPYSLFGIDVGPIIRSENGKLSLSEVSKEIGKRWKEADADTRRKYEDMALADKQRYENEMKEYKPPPSKPTKKQKDPNMPKRGMSSFMFFANDVRDIVRKENPEMSIGDIGKALGLRWKEVDEEQRKKYEEMAAKDRKRYEDEMKLYNEGKYVPTDKNNPEAHEVQANAVKMEVETPK